MTIVVNIRTAGDIKKLDGYLNRIKRIPDLTREALYDWGKILERDMKSSAKIAHIRKFTGGLYSKGIEWRQRPRGNIGRLFIRKYGLYLDSMKPHWVNITRRRTRLLLWGQQADSDLIRNASILIASGRLRKKAIFVRPHPFIRRGWQMARPKLRLMLNQHYRRVGG